MTFISDSEQIKNQIKNTMVFQFIHRTGNSLVPLRSLLLSTKYGFTAPAKKSGTVQLVRITDIQGGKINWDTVPFCECDTPEEYLLQQGDILVARTGGTVGKTFLISEKIDNAVFASYLIRLRVDKQKALPKFIFYFLNSYLYWSQITNLKSGSAQPNVNAEKMKELMIPYCDMNAQARIIDLIENEKVVDKTFINLGTVLKDAIQDYDRIEEFNKRNSELLDYTSKLRQAILHEAISGKLVSQDPSDEPASELLKKIEAEKERIFREKNIEKEKDIPPIIREETPYELPKRWSWVRIGEYFCLQTGATPSTKTPEYWGGNIKWLKSGDVNLAEIYDCKGRITEEGLAHSNCKILFPDSVLIALNGQGKTRGTVAMLRTEAACNQSLVSMRSPDKKLLIPEYLYYFLKANYMKIREITGHKQRHGLNMKIVGNILVAIPPRQEQLRIVQKVGQLTKLCDELDEKIKENQRNSEFLMEAVLREAFAS